MFLTIETKGATDILIAIPSDKIQFAQNMIDVFEKNAVFISKQWSTVDIVKPKCSIELGDTIDFNQENSSYSSTTLPDLKIRLDGDSVVEEYEKATTEVLASMKNALTHAKELLEKEKKKTSFLEDQVKQLQDKINELED